MPSHSAGPGQPRAGTSEASGSHEKFTHLASGVFHPSAPCSSLAPGPEDLLSAAASQTPAAFSQLIKDANENC